MQGTTRAVLLFLTVVGVVAAATSINQGGVLNVASYALSLQPNGGIAQGSMFVIFGAEMGPGNLVQQAGFPLPTSEGLSGTSVQVTVNGTTVNCPMIYTSAGQVAAIMPSNTPVGTGTITVTYNGQASPPQSITVVKSSFGLFAQNQQGSGPAIVQNFVSQTKLPVNTLTHSAHAGQTLILWGTGLGPVAGAEEKGPLPGNLPVDVTVWVGGKHAKVTYKGRSGCCAGIDQINFLVPQGVTGCYVQVAVQIGNVVSNYGTISIADSGDICSEPNQTMTIEELQAAVARDSLTYACFDLERICLQPLVVLPGQPSGDQCQDRARAAFGRAKLSAVNLSAFYATRSVGSCAVYSFGGSASNIPVPYPPANLDAGTININGPKGLKQLTRGANGQYQGLLGGGTGLNPLPLYLDPGSYNVDNGNGGADIGAFHLNVNFPSTLTWTNEDSITSVNRAAGVTVTWSGANGTDYVAISGLSLTGDQNSAAIGLFYCTADPAAGSFTVPPYVLLSLPAGPSIGGFPVGQLTVGETGPVQRLVAPGLDTGAYSYRITKGKNVSYQ